MGSIVTDLLARATKADIRLDPFPHLIVRDALPPEVFEPLRAGRPRFADIGWSGEPPSGQRMPYSAHQFQTQDRFHPLWRELTARMSSSDVLSRVVDLFGDHMPVHAPEVWGWVDRNPSPKVGLLSRDGFESVDVLTDARLEITTPVKGAPKSHRRAHLDTANRLFTGLFYLRDADDPLPGGDLGLYRWRAAPRETGRFEIGEDEVELAAVVPYAANTLVLFPNSRHALHGVIPRGPGPFERAYLFFTAEIASDLW